jgi:hypothetical protein
MSDEPEIQIANPMLTEIAEEWQTAAVSMLDVTVALYSPPVAVFIMILGAQIGLFRSFHAAGEETPVEFQTECAAAAMKVMNDWAAEGIDASVGLARLLTGAAVMMTALLEDFRREGKL